MSATYRRIDVSGFGSREALPAPVEEPRPELLWVPIEDLVIDDRYQRPLLEANRAKIRAIAAGFTWRHFSACLVARIEDGRFALIDGQHRAHAAALCGFDAVPALVVAMPPKAQAAAFAAVNGDLTPVSPLQVLRAALAAEEPWAIACRDAVEAAGARLMTVDLGREDRRPGQVYAVALVRQMVAAGQAGQVTRGLRALTDSPLGRHGWWPCWSVDHLRPWLRAVASVPEAGRLSEFHGDLDLDRLVGAAEALRLRPGYAGRSVAQILEETFAAMLRRRAGTEGRA